MNAGWIIPFIILRGALQSCGAAMNGQLLPVSRTCRC
jgi:transporter family-2 protein